MILDPEREGWIPGRRRFFFGLGALAAAAFLPKAAMTWVPRLRRGDLLTIEGVYSVNPLSFVTTGRLQKFVLTADVEAGHLATITPLLSPPIITSGELQTVAKAPAASAKVEVFSHLPPVRMPFHDLKPAYVETRW